MPSLRNLLLAAGVPATVTKLDFSDSETTFGSISYTVNTRCCYDSVNNKVVVAYSTAGTGKAIVGTVSGTSISFGTAVTFAAASSIHGCCYDSVDNKIIIAYDRFIIIGTVSGTSISYGAPTGFKSTSSLSASCCYDSTNNKVVIVYRDEDNSYYGTVKIGTVSGTSISFGSAVVFYSSRIGFSSCCYDITNNKVIITYRDYNTGYGKAIVGTVSGTSISFGTAVTFNFSGVGDGSISCCYDSTNNKVVIAYAVNYPAYSYVIVGTVSGTSISFGTEVTFASYGTGATYCCYDITNNKVIITYGSDSGSGLAIVGTVSGTSISFGTAVTFAAANMYVPSCCYDTTNKKVIIAYCNNSNYGAARVGTPA